MPEMAPQAVFELRPLAVADVLDVAWRIYRRHFPRLISISAALYVPLGAVYLVAAALGTPLTWIEDTEGGELPFTPEGLASLAALGVLLMLSVPVMLAAMARAVSAIYLGGTATLGEVYRFALRRWGALLGVTILFALAVGGVYFAGSMVAGVITVGMAFAARAAGTDTDQMANVAVGLMLVMIAIAMGAAAVVAVRLFFGPLAVVLEERTPSEALSRSWHLTAGRFWPVALALFVFYLFFQVLASIVVWPTQLATGVFLSDYPTLETSLDAVVWLLAQIVFQPLSTAGAVLIYYDLRVRKEAFDLEMMAQAIGGPMPPAPPPQSGAPVLPFETDAPEDVDGRGQSQDLG